MKKIIPVLVLAGFLLIGCNLLNQAAPVDQPLSDAEMATRVANLLATMTTPTAEIEFPPTPTATLEPPVLPTVAATEETPVVVTTEATLPPVITATPGGEVTPKATEEPTEAVTETLSADDPAVKLGAPTGSDPMDSYQKWVWPTDNDSFLAVAFKDGFMNLTGLTNLAGWRLPLVAQQINTYIELTVNSGDCSGKDSYGIIFRVPVFKEPNQGYLYEVTCDGYYRLWKWDGKYGANGLAKSLVTWSQSDEIKAGAKQSNRLGVMVKDKTFKLYMNGVFLDEATDSSYAAGFFGVFVRSGETPKYTVKFDQMKYWERPTQ